MITRDSLLIVKDALLAARDIQASVVGTMEAIFNQPGVMMTEAEAADMTVLRQRIEICTAGIEVVDAELEILDGQTQT